MSKIKIFVSYKNKNKLLKSEIIQPIQTGRAIADEVFEGMIGDDTGDNISVENPKYNELSAQYWVWKHFEEIGNPDFVGFMHYRRQFLFNEDLPLPKSRWFKNGPVYKFPKICDKFLDYISDEQIQKYFPEYDCVVIKPFDVNCIHRSMKTNRDRFITLKEQEGRFYDTFIEVIKELHPEYAEGIEEFDSGSIMYLCNMFIMRKDLFFEYCEFLFPILNEIDKRIDSSEFSEAKLRFLGFIGEYLLTIYIFKLRKNNNIHIKQLNSSYISAPSKKDYKKCQKYKFLRHFVFGKLKEKYEARYQELKTEIEEVNFFD